jgi:hypothetical protein
MNRMNPLIYKAFLPSFNLVQTKYDTLSNNTLQSKIKRGKIIDGNTLTTTTKGHTIYEHGKTQATDQAGTQRPPQHPKHKRTGYSINPTI